MHCPRLLRTAASAKAKQFFKSLGLVLKLFSELFLENIKKHLTELKRFGFVIGFRL